MTPNQALIRLRHGLPVDCVTPAGVSFQIQSKLHDGLLWYRARPRMRGCLNRWSRLSDGQVLEWLGSVTIIDDRGIRTAQKVSEAVSGAENVSDRL